MKIRVGDKVAVSSKFAGCFNGKTGVIVAECIPSSQLHMLTGITRWMVQFDEPVDTGFCLVEKWDFPEALLRKE